MWIRTVEIIGTSGGTRHHCFNKQIGRRLIHYGLRYIVAILETVFVTAVSSIWRQIAFKGTPLVERMSLLTLIILGEGAIAIAKACQNVAYSDGAFQFTGTTIAQIVCATLNLYFIYIIYFDW